MPEGLFGTFPLPLENNGEHTMRKIGLATILFAILATFAQAVELPRHDLTGEEVQSPIASLGMAPGGGMMAIHNYDWIPYTLEVNPHNFTIGVRTGESRRHPGAVVLNPGATVRISSPQHVWSMEGNNGRRLDFGVRDHRTIDVDLTPNGGNGMVGLEVIAQGHRHGSQELLIAWEHRPRHLMPQSPPPPPPTPYQPPYYDPYGNSSPIGSGIGGGAAPLPVVGVDPPLGSGGYPVPVVGVDPPTNPYYQYQPEPESPHRRRGHGW